jgi:hypothetical protein
MQFNKSIQQQMKTKQTVMIPLKGASNMIPSCNRSFWAVLAGVAIVVVFGALPAFGSTLTVTNANDSGGGSLRQAIIDAAPGDTINFSVTGTIQMTSDELFIGKNLAISGPGASSLAISGPFGVVGGDPIFTSTPRVFEIGSGITVAISGVTIENGTNNYGGGIYNAGTLTVTNCTLSGNWASGFFGEGGGIYNVGTLTVTSSTISGNYSAYYGLGGGIGNAGTLTLTYSTISNNSAYQGGGIRNHVAGSLIVTYSTISNNGATLSGGGIDNYGTVTVTNSTFSGNNGAFGGGIGSYGGSGIVTVSNSTFSGNNGERGGAFLNYGTMTVKNTIIANSNSIFGGNCGIPNGTFISQGYNLSDDGSCPFTQTGDLNSTPAGLGPLQNNGGPTFTQALLVGSPAIDAGDPNFDPNSFTPPLLYDQRGSGFPRVASGRIDIGAFEVPPPYSAQVQQPINPDGSSVFNVRRGVVPVKFTLTQGGVATCALPPATIALTRTAGGTTGAIDESVYSGSADTGSNFRIDSCQYIYNLSSGALGVGTYRVDIMINGQVLGSAIFQLK